MTDFITAGEVLRQQADLRDRFKNLSFATAIAGQYKYINGQSPEPKIVSAAMSKGMNEAHAYRVEHQMTDVLMARVEVMSEDATVGEPPFPAGFVVFEKPLPFKEMRGRIEHVHALSWMSVKFDYGSGPFNRDFDNFPNRDGAHYGLMVSTWNDVIRGGDEVYEELTEKEKGYLHTIGGGWSCTSIRPISDHWKVGPLWVPVPDEVKQDIRDDGYEPEDETINALRIIATTFEMLSETMPRASHTDEELTRTERKQAKHNKVSPEVVLVTLRPEVDPSRESHPGTGHPLGVRVPLGNPDDPDSIAFYRTIHKGTERERRVPVHSHWRGPEGAPVSQRKTVRNLSR